MELLKVRWNSGFGFNLNDDATRVMSINGWLTTKLPNGTPPLGDPTVLDVNAGTTTISPAAGGTSLLVFRYDNPRSRHGFPSF